MAVPANTAEICEKLTGNFVKVNGNLEKALKILKSKLKEDNWILEVKKRQHYTKPSQIRKDEKHKAKRRTKKEEI